MHFPYHLSRYLATVVVGAVLLLQPTVNTFAQTDPCVPDEEDSLEYNCVSVNSLVEALDGDLDDMRTVASLQLIRSGTDVITVGEFLSYAVQIAHQNSDEVKPDEFLATAIATCEGFELVAETEPSTSTSLFNIITPNSVNLRDCASTTCAVVRQSRAGELFAVEAVETASDGDWYQVRVDDGSAFVAARVVSRGPDSVISTDEPYLDTRTGCAVVFDVRRGSADLQFILAGDSSRDVKVDITRPNETVPLRVQGQLDKTFIDTGEPYVQQYYGFSIGWPLGVYQIDIEYNGASSRLSWDMTERASYNIYVQCTE